MQEKLHNLFLIILVLVVHYGPKQHFLANTIVGKVIMIGAIILISKAYGPLTGALSSIVFVLSMYKFREGLTMGPSYTEVNGLKSGGYELEALHPGLRTNSLVNITINSGSGLDASSIDVNELPIDMAEEPVPTEVEKAIEEAKNENEDAETSGADQMTTETDLQAKDSNKETDGTKPAESEGEVQGCALDFDTTLNMINNYNSNVGFIDTNVGRYNLSEGNVDPNAILGLKTQIANSAMAETEINSCQAHLKRLEQEQQTIYNNFESNRFLLNRNKTKLDAYGTGF